MPAGRQARIQSGSEASAASCALQLQPGGVKRNQLRAALLDRAQSLGDGRGPLLGRLVKLIDRHTDLIGDRAQEFTGELARAVTEFAGDDLLDDFQAGRSGQGNKSGHQKLLRVAARRGARPWIFAAITSR